MAEITVSGYVSSWVVLGVDGHIDGDTAAYFAPYDWIETDEAHLGINSRGSIRVRSRVDTAVGQIRTDIELRADTPGGVNTQMRYAWGEWDMTPNWTLGAGSYFQTTSLVNVPTTLNASGAIGVYNVARNNQVRLTYRDGPLSWAVALEEPTNESETAMPNIATSISYDIPGGHNVQLVAHVADLSDENANQDIGWEIGGSAGFNLGDVATLTIAGSYGTGGGTGRSIRKQSMQAVNGYGWCANNAGGAFDANGDLCESWGINAGLGFAVNDVTSFNIFGGYEDNLSTFTNQAHYSSAWVVGANVIWQPVRQLRMGWEINYGEADAVNGAGTCGVAGAAGPNCATPLADTEALMLLWHTRFFF